jgi:hypothetical protein
MFLDAAACRLNMGTLPRWGQAGDPMKTLLAVLTVVMVSSGCAPSPVPTGSPASGTPPMAAVRCDGLAETQPDVCGKMVAVVQETHPDEVRDASRILVVDTCPPRNLCDRQYLHDAVVLVVPADGDTARALTVRVLGHQGQPLGTEAWSDPLPDHVVRLLAEG